MQIRTLMGLAMAAGMAMVLALPASVSAQNPPAPQQTEAQPPEQQQVSSPVEGDLVSVDAEAKAITIKTAEGAELVIAYTDTTEISGAEQDAAGLATVKEGRVTVHFTEDDQNKARTATRIIVQPRQ